MSNMKSIRNNLETYMEQNKLYCLEGRRGVEALCQIAGALGYKDPQYFGQLTSKATIGDLICFLEDNPGAIQVVIDWIGKTRSPEMNEALCEQINFEDDDLIQQEEEDRMARDMNISRNL